MCFGAFSKYVGYKLLVLALLCIVANILLYFPNGDTRYASHNYLGKYVGCLHGIIGGGLLVLVPAFTFIGIEYDHCRGCFHHENHGRSCSLIASIVVACVGILGAGYCFIISALALAHGPYCYTRDVHSGCCPFSDSRYLMEHADWPLCQDPRAIVKWNVTLFSILLALSGIELILCTIQIINACIGGVCTACNGHNEVP
ncbi:transmembrane 4 L6 family member 1 isoform X2 [Hemicordylus capensis]|uniref:transmembrane 4 L6 family member 1 isoform X2 n=1 Tax=Hemicordylus capensis TaxID=884348 RepID=UPI002302B718|nr:transmembrane 4 L6 family member 1 isoform X2 [Hemicordylus capensis]